MSSRALVRGGAIVLGIGVLVGLRFWDKSSDGDSVKSEAAEIVAQLPGYDEEPAYFDGLLEYAHPKAFDESYRMGGRRTSAKFDEDKYLAFLFAHMQKKATEDGREEIATRIAASARLMNIGTAETETE